MSETITIRVVADGNGTIMENVPDLTAKQQQTRTSRIYSNNAELTPQPGIFDDFVDSIPSVYDLISPAVNKTADFLGKNARQIAMGSFTLGMTIASKQAGYSGNYIQQTRINETMGLALKLGAIGYGLATGNVLAIGAGVVSIGMSVWDYHEQIRLENLSANYQASYRGARMNAGKV